MNKKYELFKKNETDALYRIRALRDFSDVKAGDVGGFVEGEDNLSHVGDCWIYDGAKVYGNARVSGNARVYDNASVFGNALISGNARVFDNASVVGDAVVGEENYVFAGNLITDITGGQNKLDAIRCSVEDVKLSEEGTEITCYKKVCDDLSSLYNPRFKYEVGKWVEEPNYDPDPAVSCGRGLHFAGPNYWDEGMVLLECHVEVDDIIAVQHGKIRAKRAFVIKKIDI